MNNRFLMALAVLVFPVLFNLLFFMLGGTEHPASVWLSYAFIHVAYACLAVLPAFCRVRQGLAVLAASLYYMPLGYFLAELALGLVWILLAPEATTWPLLTQSLLFAAFFVAQLAMVMANKATTASLDRQEEESLFLRQLTEQLRSRLAGLRGSDARPQVERCYEALVNSSVQSCPEAAAAEAGLQAAVAELCAAIDAGQGKGVEALADKVQAAVRERAAALRLRRRA